jgi:DNA sulfur modification protein DndD
MILTKITLHNFGIYAGRHEIDISPKPNKPVVLFGALNGSGKTTLLEGIQFALFGKYAKFLGKTKSAYLDFLINSVNRKNHETSSSVAVAFTTNRGSEKTHYEIVRTWSISASNTNAEEVQVFKNSELDNELSERWAELSENFFPSQLSDLFFFDGERIESLAQPARCSELIRTGLNSLLGLDLVTDLSKTLLTLERRLKTEEASPDNRDKLIRLDEKKLVVTEQLRVIDTELRDANLALASFYSELDNLKTELKLKGGDLYVKRDELTQKQSVLMTDVLSKRGELIEIASTNLPLSLLSKLLAQLEKLSLTSLSIEQKEAVQDALSAFSQNVITEISTRKALDESQLELLTQIHETFLHIDTQKSTRPNIAISRDSLSRIRSEGAALKGSALKCVLELASLEAEQDRVHRQLLAVPDSSKLQPLFLQIRSVEDKIQKLESSIVSLSDQSHRLTKDKDASDVQYDSISTENLKHQAQGLLIEKMKFQLVRGRETLAKFEGAIRTKHLVTLEKLILEGFQQLLRKKSFIQSISIDPNNFLLTIKVIGEGDVPSSKLSAGERQLLAVAVLWALAKASGRKLPTVIDTPLGRLDSKHRTEFVNNYFPNAGAQVILLSTDEEIVGTYYRSIKKHTAHQYLIEYDEAAQSSRISKGYFEDTKEAA